MSSGEQSGRDNLITSWEEIPGPDVGIIGFVARPDVSTPAPTLVVIPENLGISEWRQEESRRMAAELGWVVVVMSPYSRIGGAPPAGPFASNDERRRAAFLAMPDEQVARDLSATTAWTRRQSYTDDRLPAVLGFCSGGGQALYSACTRPREAACVVSIYGNLVLRQELTEDRQPIDRIPLAGDLECPLQLHVGTEDVEIPPTQVDRFEAELRHRAKTYEIYRYAGAGHVFADPTLPFYNAGATEAMWPRVLRFLRHHTGDPAQGGGPA